jgi:hypothetical protein
MCTYIYICIYIYIYIHIHQVLSAMEGDRAVIIKKLKDTQANLNAKSALINELTSKNNHLELDLFNMKAKNESEIINLNKLLDFKNAEVCICVCLCKFVYVCMYV